MPQMSQCPTCQAVIAVGAAFCSGCGTRLSWVQPGAAQPPSSAPPAAPPRASDVHWHHPRGRRGGASSGIWVIGILVVVLATGGFVLSRMRSTKPSDEGPVLLPRTSTSAGAPGSSTGGLSPFLDHLNESYPDFFKDLSYSPKPEPVLPAAKTYAHRRSIASEYFAYRDCTFFVMYPFGLNVSATSGGGAGLPHTLAAFVGIHGRASRGVPYVVTLVFGVDAPQATYPSGVSLALTADATTFPAVRSTWSEAFESGGRVRQTVVFPVRTSTIVKLLDAKQAGGRLGSTEFVLPEEDLEGLRDFMSRLGPDGR